jgi:hypothetical protein
MSNATDSLIEAEKMIRSTFSKTEEREIALQICHWLLNFNITENRFRIKCYSTRIPDICFCVDSGGDCDSKNIRTWFFRIRASKSLFMIFKLIKPNGTYLNLQSGRGINTDNTFITYAESKKLNFEIIKKHIFESYELQLNKLKLVSKVSSTNNALSENAVQQFEYADRPSKEDIDSAELQLRSFFADEVIGEEAVLDQVKKNLEMKGIPLKENWRETAKLNINIWFRKNNRRS